LAQKMPGAKVPALYHFAFNSTDCGVNFYVCPSVTNFRPVLYLKSLNFEHKSVAIWYTIGSYGPGFGIRGPRPVIISYILKIVFFLNVSYIMWSITGIVR
jgi:hypothetical protein